jgi:serine protease AprX
MITKGHWSFGVMAERGARGHRDGVNTQRGRLAQALLAGVVVTTLVGMSPSPAAAEVGPLMTWIVTYDAPPTSDQLDVLEGVSDAVHGFTEVPAAVVVAPATEAGLLRGLPGVQGVYPNEAYHYLSDLATQSSGAAWVWQDLGYTGAGIGIAVIDAGVDGTHPDLCAAAVFCKGTPIKTVQNVKILGRQEVAVDPVVVLDNQLNTDSSSGHGSHVASIAAGWGSAGVDPTKYRGVAYGANLIGFGTGELVEAENVLAAFDYAISHRDQYNIKVINNSWGPGAFTPYDPEHPVNRAIDAAWSKGISVVFGAGNDGTRTDSMNMFSINPHAISVGSGMKNHQQAFYSSKGVPGNPQLHPTVTAPGDSITSVRASTGFTIDAADASGVAAPDGDAATGADAAYYAVSSGTSMASPHIAGVVALMQQAAMAKTGRYLTPLEVRNILQNTASPMVGYQQYAVGAGFVDALAATKAAAGLTRTNSYDSKVNTDVVPFAGTVGPAAGLPTSSFTSTYTVLPGAAGLDVMVDWGPEKVLATNTDVDIDLYRPDGTSFGGTFLKCDPSQQPNGYSSYCSSAPHEHLSVVAPVAGTWTVNVHGGVYEVQDAVRGLWATTYPKTVLLPARPAAAIVLTGSQPASVTGQSVDLVATVTNAAGLPVPNVPVSLTTTGVGAVGRATTVSDSYGRVHAQALSGAPGPQTITATASGRSSSVAITWLGLVLPDTACLPGCLALTDTAGKVSGGGSWNPSGGKRTLAVTAEHSQLSTSTSGQVTYDNRCGAKVTQAYVQHLSIDSSNVATLTGFATFNGTSGHPFTLTVTDRAAGDVVRLVVTSPGGSVVLDEAGVLTKGDISVVRS